MKQKYLLLTMILSVFLILFFTTSSAFIPGDFGGINNGQPGQYLGVTNNGFRFLPDTIQVALANPAQSNGRNSVFSCIL